MMIQTMNANSTLLLFLIAALGLTVILAFIVIYPWRRRTGRSISDVNLTSLNISIFKERLAELETDYLSKVIENDEYVAQKIDLQRQLLAASTQNAKTTGIAISTTELSTVSLVLPRWLVLIVFFSIPVLCFSTYYFWTRHQQSQHRALLDFWVNQDKYAEVADKIMTGKLSQPPILASNQLFNLLQSMQVNAYQYPFDAKRWLRLSEFYMQANAIEPALTAAEHAYRLQPENNDIAMSYARMRVMDLRGKMDRTTLDIVTSTLLRHPKDERALLLMSMAAYQNQHYSEAIDWLERLKRIRLARATFNQPANAAMLAQLDQAIDRAESANKKLIQSSADHAVSVR
jgi:cytochrome c-type biogenesis protein CcmH